MKKLFAFLLIFISLTACGETSSNEADEMTSVKNQLAYSADILKTVKSKKDELNKEHAPFGVTAVYEGTPTDMNNDGCDDFVYAFSLYNQFQLFVIDSTDGTYLMDETIMTAFDADTCIVEFYTDTYGACAVKAVGQNVYAAEAALTETVQIINGEGSFILEAVYDKETNEFLHAYDKYTLEEYQKRQDELLNGYTLLQQIAWNELKEG